MKIILIRHGLVNIDMQSRISVKDFETWVTKYNEAEVSPISTGSNQLKQIVAECNLLLASSYPRAVTSAETFGKCICKKDPLFREADLPVLKIPIVKFKPNTWCFINRIAWLLGYASGLESRDDFFYRVLVARDALIDFANEHGSIALVAHGFINKFLARQFLKLGWSQMSPIYASKHWGYSVLTSPDHML